MSEIKSQPSNKKYRKGWDRVFKKNQIVMNNGSTIALPREDDKTEPLTSKWYGGNVFDKNGKIKKGGVSLHRLEPQDLIEEEKAFNKRNTWS